MQRRRSPNLPLTPAWFSVHRLKLADIKVIAALGDSLTVSYPAGEGRGRRGADPGSSESPKRENLTPSS